MEKKLKQKGRKWLNSVYEVYNHCGVKFFVCLICVW